MPFKSHDRRMRLGIVELPEGVLHQTGSFCDQAAVHAVAVPTKQD